MTPDYPTHFFFEAGGPAPYLALVGVTVALAVAAWAAIRYRPVALALFIVIPVALTLFWWPWSTAGTASSGWFPIVKQYSALLGSLSLVALQVFPKLRKLNWYLCLPALILAVNIAEAVVRDFQCASINGFDPTQHMWITGGYWNVMNAIAGILNLLMISGWVGIRVAPTPDKRITWGDLTVPWIIAYDLWNFAYVYNCLADRAWYSGVALLTAATIPAFLKFGRGAWIQYRAYTLTLWSAVVLTFPHLTEDSAVALRASHNTTALALVSGVALAVNIAVFVYHVHTIRMRRRNPLTAEVYA